ncbi:EamA family transporter [Altererythrobacter confluentis]|uniref:EamA family transporter n=1 Tax=Allopontixanthobacter confluentis TaxID=1849021 RepID=A0A6L7GJV0_9SPHN|nr:DMT family transporter [Allopontixanthobacter confluentis]MXP15584.1 EamA family transporter [Allopontixanthobacter confluentis]
MPDAATSTRPIIPVLTTIAGIAVFSLMDAFMKSASMAAGAYSALLVRSVIGVMLVGPAWWIGSRKWPQPAVIRLHLRRGVVIAGMALTFFFALVRLPLAEAIAMSFIAPLIALFLAAMLLGEKIQPRAIIAALLGLGGVIIIVGGRVGRERMTDDAMIGLAALFISAVLYAWNLVLQREQALVARPVEVATFQNGIVGLALLGPAPFLFSVPPQGVWGDLVAAAVLGVAASMILSWSYARAETQRLVPVEYTGFLWAVLFGWIFFREPVSPATIAGAVLIVFGCWIGTRSPAQHAPPGQGAV